MIDPKKLMVMMAGFLEEYANILYERDRDDWFWPSNWTTTDKEEFIFLCHKRNGTLTSVSYKDNMTDLNPPLDAHAVSTLSDILLGQLQIDPEKDKVL